jgi:predicted phage tail protein
LSRLRNAHVASRTDTTQDVNNQFVAATRRLADDTALRTSLLKQLANAATRQQIDSLNAQIHDTEAAIAGDQAAIRTLNRQIDFSQISLTINAGVVPVAHSSSTFTIGKGAQDAGRVLTVAAGVALIVLAALVPVTLLAALSWWIGAAVRRRRREQALDLA